MQENNKEEWEVEFDLIPHGAPLSRHGDYISVVNAKNFIKQTLSKREAEIREHVEGIIKRHTGVNLSKAEKVEEGYFSWRLGIIEMGNEVLSLLQPKDNKYEEHTNTMTEIENHINELDELNGSNK